MKTKELLAHIRRHANDIPYSLNVHEWAAAAISACCIIDQLQAENDKLKKAFRILSPYHGKTNPEGRLEAIEDSIKFIKNKFTKHDAGAISDCVCCHVVSLARWVSDIIDAPKGELESELKHEQYIKENRK